MPLLEDQALLQELWLWSGEIQSGGAGRSKIFRDSRALMGICFVHAENVHEQFN